MTTKELLNRMPKEVVNRLEQGRKDYHNNALDQDKVRSGNAQYVLGLRDAGLITDRERMKLFIYTTV